MRLAGWLIGRIKLNSSLKLISREAPAELAAQPEEASPGTEASTTKTGGKGR